MKAKFKKLDKEKINKETKKQTQEQNKQRKTIKKEERKRRISQTNKKIPPPECFSF